MPVNPHPRRRDFLKTAAAGAAGAMGISALKFDKLFAQSTGGWVSGLQVNPAIDNKRVICCHDTNMLTSLPVNNAFTDQNDAVNANLVASNLDQMAMQLAQKTAAADAWSMIFQQPTSKTWANTKVAIKTNAIGGAARTIPGWRLSRRSAMCWSTSSGSNRQISSCTTPIAMRRRVTPPMPVPVSPIRPRSARW